jgi:hypothetical protein
VHAPWFGLFRVRSPLLAESLICFLFLQVLRWFTSLRCPRSAYGFSGGFPGMTPGGLPHSGIVGSKPVCGSPTLFAAYHALHRLLAPRHSPCALSSLTIRIPDTDSRAPRTRAPNPSHRWPTVRSPKPDALERQLQLCTLRVCGRKTTVAEYSVVKEPDVRHRQRRGFRPRRRGFGAAGSGRISSSPNFSPPSRCALRRDTNLRVACQP